MGTASVGPAQGLPLVLLQPDDCSSGFGNLRSERYDHCRRHLVIRIARPQQLFALLIKEDKRDARPEMPLHWVGELSDGASPRTTSSGSTGSGAFPVSAA